MTTLSRLTDAVDEILILDTHEHLPVHPRHRKTPCDVLTEYLSHYFDKDLISAGMPPAVLAHAMDVSIPIADRFAALAPWWDICRTTGYGRSLDIAARGLYGVRGVHQDTIEQMDHEFQKGVSDPGHFRKVLKDKCRIARSINDGFWHMTEPGWSDDELFIQVKRLDGYLNEWHYIWHSLEHTGVRIEDFDSFLAAVGKDMELALACGYQGFKLGVAYGRTLDFPLPEEKLARTQFDACFAQHKQGEHPALPLELQNYILHHCLKTLSTLDSFLQIHTGFQEGNGNYVANSDPMKLTQLFMDYPQVRFDLFHIGYPYWESVGILGKLFPNVTVDFAWVNIISPSTAERALNTYLDLMPRNKILAFGGDYLFVDGVYAHQKFARRAVSRVLAQRVDSEEMDVEEAVRTARMLLHDNAVQRLNLKL